MQQDIDLIYECIFEETYKDKSCLEIVVSKVECREMAIGFLMDLALKSKQYGVDKEELPRMIAEYVGEPQTHDYMIACHKDFVKVMRAKNDEQMEESKFIEKALRLLIFGKGQPFDEFMSQSKQEYIKALKAMLLESEAYEYIASIDRHII